MSMTILEFLNLTGRSFKCLVSAIWIIILKAVCIRIIRAGKNFTLTSTGGALVSVSGLEPDGGHLTES